MLNLILKVYMNYKKENFKEVWERFRQLPIHIIALFIVIFIISGVLEPRLVYDHISIYHILYYIVSII